MVHKVLNLPNAGVLNYIFLCNFLPVLLSPHYPFGESLQEDLVTLLFSPSFCGSELELLRGACGKRGHGRGAAASRAGMGPAPSGCAGRAPSPSGCRSCPQSAAELHPRASGWFPAAPGPCGGRAAPGGSSAPGMRGRAPALRGCPRGKQRTGRGAPGGSLNGKTFLEWKASPRSNTFRAWLEWCWLCGNWCRKGRQSNKLMSQLRNARLITLLSFCL